MGNKIWGPCELRAWNTTIFLVGWFKPGPGVSCHTWGFNHSLHCLMCLSCSIEGVMNSRAGVQKTPLKRPKKPQNRGDSVVRQKFGGEVLDCKFLATEKIEKHNDNSSIV